VRFLPFVLNSYGRMGLSAHRVLNVLAYTYAERHLLSVAEAKGRIRGSIMLAIPLFRLVQGSVGSMIPTPCFKNLLRY
jgi:hypothetical protein